MTINDRVEDALEKANKARDEKRYDEAASFYRKALSLNSKEARAYYGLGNISFDQGDYAGAANSYEQVSRLRGGDPDISIRIGYLYSKLGDYQKAIEKFEAVIRAKPEFEYGMFLLAWNYLYKNDGTNAASTAKRYLERNGWKDLYGALIGYVGYSQSNQLIMAENFLRNATEMISVRDWPYPIIKYLKKEMTAVALLAQATDRGRLTEVKTYIGLDISLPNHNREALEHLRWVKENGDHEYFEYPLAVEELGRLKR